MTFEIINMLIYLFTETYKENDDGDEAHFKLDMVCHLLYCKGFYVVMVVMLF